MRDPGRIPMILAAVARRWEQQPDLRLGQFLALIADERDVRHIEDGELLRRIGPVGDAEQEYVEREPRDRAEAWREFTRRAATDDPE